MKRCSKCILPDVYPNITFDEQGECYYCKAHQKIQYLGTSKLKDELTKYRNSTGKYDCLVPISGGKDSIIYADGDYGSISGGQGGSVHGIYSSISGGYANVVNSNYSSITGGYRNNAKNLYSSISGGYGNSVAG